MAALEREKTAAEDAHARECKGLRDAIERIRARLESEK